jgi:hypothetical protein
MLHAHETTHAMLASQVWWENGGDFPNGPSDVLQVGSRLKNPSIAAGVLHFFFSLG